MNKFTAKKFNIPELKGISKKNIEEHIKLYEGYVNNANTVIEKIGEYKKEKDKNIYALGELMRRFSFEWNGMKNHEIYFNEFEDGPNELDPEGDFAKAITAKWGSVDEWLTEFKTLALTRGIGWAMLSYDPHLKVLLNSWVDEQHLGQLNGCVTILGLDMWEHSYVSDYYPSGKKTYVEDFFANLNWKNIEENFARAK